MSHTARRFIDEAASAGSGILLSAISIAEVVYLVEKKRLPAAAYEDLTQALRNPDYVIEEAPFNVAIIEAMRNVSRDKVPDMPDRIVAATALRFGVSVISRDRQIRSSNVETIW